MEHPGQHLMISLVSTRGILPKSHTTPSILPSYSLVSVLFVRRLSAPMDLNRQSKMESVAEIWIYAQQLRRRLPPQQFQRLPLRPPVDTGIIGLMSLRISVVIIGVSKNFLFMTWLGVDLSWTNRLVQLRRCTVPHTVLNMRLMSKQMAMVQSLPIIIAVKMELQLDG